MRQLFEEYAGAVLSALTGAAAIGMIRMLLQVMSGF